MDRGLSALRHAGALLDFSMPPCGTMSPSVTWTATGSLIGQEPPQAQGRSSLRPGETVQTRAVNQQPKTVWTRAVNQQARTMTPKEAKTLLSVNTHHNSRLLNLD